MLCKLKSIVFALCFFASSALYSQMPKHISEFSKLPRSIAKDYYIYRFLNERSLSPQEAQNLLEQTKRVNFKLFYSLAKKMKDKGFTKVSKCLRLKTIQLIKEDDECIAIGLSVYDALSLNKKTLKSLIPKLNNYKDVADMLKILSSKDIFKTALEDNKKFIYIFNRTGAKNRKKFFDKEIKPNKINQLSKIYGFNKSIRIILTQRDLKNLEKSLLDIKINPNLSSNTLFFLALNAIEFNKKIRAMKLLEHANKKAYYRFDKDKILFWSYLVSKEKKYLQELNKSFDVNIYTIFAHEKLSTKFTNIIITKTKNKDKKYDIQDPFLWTKLLRELRDKNSTQLNKIAEKFNFKNTISQYTFIKQRADRYRVNYFPFPFQKFLKAYSIKRKALILAISKQESNFIPASVSTSYALGMMQIMPFLARAISKEIKLKNFDIDEMFNPKTAYKFANIQLNYLKKTLGHPLFIAYGYNGGAGYTKRAIKSGNLFKKRGEYEPYLDMELLSSGQTRKYGKKVLANYIIYMQLFGEKISLKKEILDIYKFYDKIGKNR